MTKRNAINWNLPLEVSVIGNNRLLRVTSFPANAFQNQKEFEKHWRQQYRYGQLILHVKQVNIKKTLVL